MRPGIRVVVIISKTIEGSIWSTQYTSSEPEEGLKSRRCKIRRRQRGRSTVCDTVQYRVVIKGIDSLKKHYWHYVCDGFRSMLLLHGYCRRMSARLKPHRINVWCSLSLFSTEQITCLYRSFNEAIEYDVLCLVLTFRAAILAWLTNNCIVDKTHPPACKPGQISKNGHWMWASNIASYIRNGDRSNLCNCLAAGRLWHGRLGLRVRLRVFI